MEKKSHKNSDGNFFEKVVVPVYLFLLGSAIITSIYFAISSNIKLNLKLKLIPNPNIFRRTSAILENCTVYKIIETKNELALVGVTSAKDAFIAKIDLNAARGGKIAFFCEYGGSDVDFFNDIIETEDGCLIASGYTSSLDNDLETAERYGESDKGYNWVLKIDPNKNDVIFNKCYDMKNGIFKKMVESNGKLFFCTAPDNYTSVPPTPGIYREQIPSKGNIIGIDPSVENEGGIFFNRVFGNDNEFYIFYDMLKARNGNLVLSGGYKSNQVERNNVRHNYYGGEDGFIMEFSPQTELVVFFQCYGGKKRDRLFSIRECRDGRFIAVGEQLSAKNLLKTWILKIDLKRKNNYIFSKIYPDKIQLSKLPFAEDIAGNLNFPLTYQHVNKDSTILNENILEVISINSGKGKLQKNHIVLDSDFSSCDNILITKTKKSEIVVIAKIDKEFILFKLPRLEKMKYE